MEPEATVACAAVEDDSWRIPHAKVEVAWRARLDLACPIKLRESNDILVALPVEHERGARQEEIWVSVGLNPLRRSSSHACLSAAPLSYSLAPTILRYRKMTELYVLDSSGNQTFVPAKRGTQLSYLVQMSGSKLESTSAHVSIYNAGEAQNGLHQPRRRSSKG